MLASLLASLLAEFREFAREFEGVIANVTIFAMIAALKHAVTVLDTPSESAAVLNAEQDAYRRGARDAYLAVIDALSELL